MAENKQDYLTYKGRPLVRKGDTLYYGDMAEQYVIKMKITESQKDGGVQHATKVLVQMLDTDQKGHVLKKSEKNGLYEAMDIGAIWLDRALAEKS